ncbi:GUN4 domain protein [Nostoc sp. NIES-4103]|nr:GUN4 domain protein [Nostoc sp. NIES-4103]
MKLSGQQSKELQNALIDTFPDAISLDRMLSFELEKNLRAIAGEGSLQDIIFKLIQTANSQGWIEDLVRAACKSNPRNPRLRAIVEELFTNHSQTPPFTSSKNPPKSSVHQVPLLSEKGINYSKLRDFLANEQWKDADNETEMLILEAAHRKGQLLNVESIQKLPITDLCTIDQLWVTSSRGHFGFSVQKQIWQEHQKNTDNEYELYCLFGNSVGWRKHGRWLWYKDMTFNLSAPKGHFPQHGLEAVLLGKTIDWWKNESLMSLGLGEKLFSEFFYRVLVL